MVVTIVLWAALLVGIVLPPAPAAAEEKADYARPGLYLGLGALYAFEDFDLEAPSGVNTSVKNSWGLDARAGYRYRYAAIEAQFQYYDEFVLSANGGHQDNMSAESGSANLKGYPFGGRIQPYALAGFGFMRASTDVDGQGASRAEGAALIADPGTTQVEFIGRFGGGVDAYVTSNVVVYLEGTYLVPTAEIKDFNVIPLAFGVQYRFD